MLLFSSAIFAQDGLLGRVHGRVTDPTGVPKTNGTVGLSTDGGRTYLYVLPVSATGDFFGAGIAPGIYSLVFRLPDTRVGKFIDMVGNVQIIAGQDTAQDLDMSRPEYLAKMTPEQQKQVEDFRKKNAEIMRSNQLISALNADLAEARQDIRDGNFYPAYVLMLKDTSFKPDGVLLWFELGRAQLGIKQYNDAVVSFGKVLELDAASGKSNPSLVEAARKSLNFAIEMRSR